VTNCRIDNEKFMANVQLDTAKEHQLCSYHLCNYHDPTTNKAKILIRWDYQSTVS